MKIIVVEEERVVVGEEVVAVQDEEREEDVVAMVVEDGVERVEEIVVHVLVVEGEVVPPPLAVMVDMSRVIREKDPHVTPTQRKAVRAEEDGEGMMTVDEFRFVLERARGGGRLR